MTFNVSRLRDSRTKLLCTQALNSHYIPPSPPADHKTPIQIGVIIGPLLGGFLADPAQSYPSLFGSTAFFIAFPYALPNLVSAAILASALILVWLCLDEVSWAFHQPFPSLFPPASTQKNWPTNERRKTLNTLRSRPDRGRRLKTQLGRLWTRTLQGCLGNRNDVSYTALPSTPPTQSSSSSPAHNGGGSDGDDRVPEKGRRAYRNRLPFRRLFTRNVVATLAAHFALALHLGAFTALLFVFLATPVFDPAAAVPPGFLAPAPPFRAAGGLGLPAADVGVAMALFGVFGITAQLLLYPRVAGMRRRRGGGPNGGPLMPTIWSWRLGLALFPAVYALVPLLTVVPSSTAPPGPKTGPRVWAALAGVLGLQVLGRTFALPAQAILLNNSVPHPSVLATLHGLSQSVASLARAVGPAAAGWLYGAGLVRGLVGAVFWGLAAVAAAGLGLSFLCREGDGHEIRLEGDAEE